MEDLKYFISESQRFRTAADDVEEEAMISQRGSLRRQALIFMAENTDTIISVGEPNLVWPCIIGTFWQWSSTLNKHELWYEKYKPTVSWFNLQVYYGRPKFLLLPSFCWADGLHPTFHLESRLFPTPQVDSVHTGASAWGIMGWVVENLLPFFKLRLKIALSITAGDRT